MATCLYKAKPCATCKRLIQVGEECEYIPKTKGVRHYGCEPAADLFDATNAEALAERLGFINVRPDMGSDGLLRLMSRKTGGPSTAGTES